PHIRLSSSSFSWFCPGECFHEHSSTDGDGKQHRTPHPCSPCGRDPGDSRTRPRCDNLGPAFGNPHRPRRSSALSLGTRWQGGHGVRAPAVSLMRQAEHLPNDDWQAATCKRPPHVWPGLSCERKQMSRPLVRTRLFDYWFRRTMIGVFLATILGVVGLYY